MARRLLIAVLGLLPVSGAAEVLRYVIRAEPFEAELTLPDGSRQVRQLPRQPAYFFHRADFRWPIPEGPSDTAVTCEVEWRGFPDGFRLINSYGTGERSQKFDTTLGKLRKAVFAGGDFRTATSREGLLLVTREKWPVPDQRLIEWIDIIAREHTAVWKDRGLPGHRVWLIATAKPGSGEGRTHGAILEWRPDSFDEPDVMRALSHELFHEWNPRRVHFNDNEELYWFTEGFTDYYSVISLRRGGLWDFPRFLDYVNIVLRTYHASSARNLTPARMVETRKSSLPAERLPYQQGFLLAANWNLTGRSLDGAMRALLLRPGSGHLSNETIGAALRSIGVENAPDEIQRFIERGETIRVRPDLLGPCAKITEFELRPFDMGFNEKESRRGGIITGARPGSNAWRAGVRDGQKWSALDVVFGDPTYPAKLEIEDQSGRRRIEYVPAASEVIHVPRFERTPEPCAAP